MNISTVHALFFSPTFSTRTFIREVVRELGVKAEEHDLTRTDSGVPVSLGETDLLVVGVPVYAGRVPALAVERLRLIRGNRTPAIVICVYGNRDYDDALIELRDIVSEQGFIPLAAAALVAQHSIFPQVAANRPDAQDFCRLKEFCREVSGVISSLGRPEELPALQVRGHVPYLPAKKVPIHPTGNRTCNRCGTCVRQCPVEAISAESPRRTDKARCISCGRCIVVCPQKARQLRGLLFALAKRKFPKKYAERKEPVFFY